MENDGIRRIGSIWILLILAVSSYTSCKTSSGVSGRNISRNYATIDDRRVSYKVIHTSDAETRVWFSINPVSDERVLDFSIRYRIYENYSSPAPIDSGMHVFQDLSVSEHLAQKHFIVIPKVAGRNAVVDLLFKDLNSSYADRQFLDLINPKELSDQSYELRTSDGALRMNSFLPYADSVLFVFDAPQQRLAIRHYDRDFPMAAPPFSVINPKPFDFRPDEWMRVEALNDRTFQSYITQKGLYQVLLDSLDRSGGTFHYFGPHYPRAKTVNDLFMPLRYITTTPEYNEMTEGGELKKSVDAFWLKIGGNEDRARMLIQAYYSRVERANELFTSYMEGWKTDRGMCYIVFGPPTKVYRTTAAETWVYGEEGKYRALTMTFTKVVNPFTNNDFRLNRSASLKSPWYRAVEFWRQGRVITYQ